MNAAKKIAAVLILVLAINFLLVAGAVGFLFASGALSKEKLLEIGTVLYPQTTQPTTQPASTPDADPATTQPLMKLDELLAATAGKPAAEQLEYVQQAFDRQMAMLDRERQNVLDLKRQVELARAQFIKDKAELDTREKSVAARDEQLTRRVVDKGFTESLRLYNQLSTRQVKELFAGLDDDTVVRYLQAMDPKRASRVLSEFKTPAEISRAQALLEKMRKNDVKPPEAPSTSGNPPVSTGASDAFR